MRNLYSGLALILAIIYGTTSITIIIIGDYFHKLPLYAPLSVIIITILAAYTGALWRVRHPKQRSES